MVNAGLLEYHRHCVQDHYLGMDLVYRVRVVILDPQWWKHPLDLPPLRERLEKMYPKGLPCR